MEIASPVVVNENGDSRVSRKWERLALRGSMVALCAWALFAWALFAWALFACALFVVPRALSACALCSALKQLGLVQPDN